MSARLVPLAQGDCRDYRTWLLADRGIKDEQTTVDQAAIAVVTRFLARSHFPGVSIRAAGKLLFLRRRVGR